MTVTVAVPVFNALGDVQACLGSLERTLTPDADVLLIDDASTEPGVREALTTFERRAPFPVTIIRHAENIGFVASANEAMDWSNGDIVLLNSDTVTTQGWLTRLQAAAVGRERVATVTPFTNNGEICSFPRFCANNPAPDDPDAYARVFAEAGEPDYPELPTGVGFCLYVTRAAIDAVGVFDAARFGRGYGEENDFCRRAVAAGFANVLCDDAFVVHRGGASFRPLGLGPDENAMARLLERHPDYQEIVDQFIRDDPLASRRAELEAALVAANVTESPPMNAPTLAFDGERFTPECLREIWYEHWHRYVFATEFVRDRTVLDLACGEGYGSDLLAQTASSVVGVDVSEAAIAHARRRYGQRANLRFRQGDCAAIPADDQAFDVVVSFETLEHVEAQAAMLDEFRRVLRRDGVLIISTPDKRVYSDVTGYDNEFHVRELYRPEFEALLQDRFEQVGLYGQKLLFHSAIWAMPGADSDADDGVSVATLAEGPPRLSSTPGYDPMYFIALASNGPLPTVNRALWLFADSEESVYDDYRAEVRRNQAGAKRIAELEAQLAERSRGEQESPQESTPWWRRWRERNHD